MIAPTPPAPSAAQAAERDGLERAIRERLQHSLPGGAGALWRIQVTPLAPGLTHRHSSNTVFQYRAESVATGECRTLIAKHVPAAVAPDGDREEYAMLKRLHGHAALAAGGFAVPAPLEHLADLRVVVMAKVEGELLDDVLRPFAFASYPRYSRLLRRCGRLLRVFHEVNALGEAPGIPDEVFDKIAENAGALPADDLTASLAALRARVAPALAGGTLPLVRQHGDYGLGNIIEGAGHLTLIDFSFCGPEITFNDIARFLSSLEMHCFVHHLLRLAPLPQWSAAFLAGYQEGAAPLSPRHRALLSLYKIRHMVIKYHVDHALLLEPGAGAARRARLLYHRRTLRRELRHLESACAEAARANGAS